MTALGPPREYRRPSPSQEPELTHLGKVSLATEGGIFPGSREEAVGVSGHHSVYHRHSPRDLLREILVSESILGSPTSGRVSQKYDLQAVKA